MSSTSCTSRRVTNPAAARTPSAIGRSNDDPALRMSAGARLTVIRFPGKSKPELRIALRIRSRLSRTDASGRPTMLKDGMPCETSTSTWTPQASMPKTAAERMHASMRAWLQTAAPSEMLEIRADIRPNGAEFAPFGSTDFATIAPRQSLVLLEIPDYWKYLIDSNTGRQ